MSDELVVNNQIIETIFEIAQKFGGKYYRVGKQKRSRQKLWRVNAIIVEYTDHRAIWSIWPNGNTHITHVDYMNKDGKYTGWKELEK